MFILHIKNDNLLLDTRQFNSNQEAVDYASQNNIISYSIIDVQAQFESDEALRYLRDTDWYIIREMDSGEPCPPEIKAARAAARLKVL